MPITTTPSECIGLCTRMRRFLVRFIRPESFVHTRSSAGFTITTSGFKFSVHMLLACIEPGPAGSDLRTFECSKCEHVHKALAEDPMKSGTAGWLASELKPPK